MHCIRISQLRVNDVNHVNKRRKGTLLKQEIRPFSLFVLNFKDRFLNESLWPTDWRYLNLHFFFIKWSVVSSSSPVVCILDSVKESCSLTTQFLQMTSKKDLQLHWDLPYVRFYCVSWEARLRLYLVVFVFWCSTFILYYSDDLLMLLIHPTLLVLTQ